MRIINFIGKKKFYGIPAILIVGIFFSAVILLFLPGVISVIKAVLYWIDNKYIKLIEILGNALLYNHSVRLENQQIFYQGQLIKGFSTESIIKKLTFFIILVYWLTRTSYKKKIHFTLITIISQYFLVLYHNILGVYYSVNGMAIGDNELFPAISYTTGEVVLVSLLFIWINKNEKSYYLIDPLIGSLKNVFEKKWKSVVIIVYLYILLTSFILQYYEFRPWIDFLFVTARKILSFLGYYVTVEPSLLIGENGSIYMAKACLGLKTMLLFASVVYVTGDDNRKRWSYILFGIVLLNIVNIFRFVFLFIHIQKYGGYELSIDLHDLYDYITYTIVFVLWVIWFEKFSDIGKREKKGKKRYP